MNLVERLLSIPFQWLALLSLVLMWLAVPVQVVVELIYWLYSGEWLALDAYQLFGAELVESVSQIGWGGVRKIVSWMFDIWIAFPSIILFAVLTGISESAWKELSGN